MRLEVIGGRGFIGSHVVRRLAERGHDPVVVRRGEGALDCDAAIQLFAMTAEHAVHFVRQFQNRAGRLLVVSSGDVYRAYGVLKGTESATIDPLPQTEDSPLRTVFYPYPEYPEYDKIPVERIVREAGPDNCVLRLPAVYGPDDSHHRVGTWLRLMSTPDASVPIGEHQAKWRWTHGYVENVADAIALAAVDARSGGRTYNVGEPFTPTMQDRVRQWGRVFGWHGDFTLQPDSAGFRQNLIMDSTRIREELGFAEIVNEEESLQRTIAWEADFAGSAS